MSRSSFNEIPKNLKPYHFHGVDFSGSGKNVYADCPFCDKEGKLSIEVSSGFWRCLSCQIAPNGKTIDTGGGNVTDFLKVLHRESVKATEQYQYAALAKQRGIAFPETLVDWELGVSLVNGDWLVPGYSMNGEIGNIYRWTGKHLYATTDQDHRLHGYNLWDDSKEYVDWLEGPWDAMAFYETINRCKVVGSLYMPSGLDGSTLGASSNVLAVPGSGVFLKAWAKACNGKHVRLWYDNDHPVKHKRTGVELPPNGLSAARRTTGIIMSNASPASVQFCRWGNHSFENLTGFNLDLPHGFDVRDLLNA
jgi:ribosomal protein L37AE/L43A